MSLSHERSHELAAEAGKYLVGGVDSPVRAFRAVGSEPIIAKSGNGGYVTDEDGSRVTDDDGVYKTEPLTGEEKAKKDAKVLEVEQKLP